MTPLPILFAQWNTADGRFMVCRFARGLQCLSDAAVTKNQHAPRLPSGTPRECVTLSYVMRDEESGAVVLDPKTEDTTYLEEFQKVEVREAADREHSLQRGFAIGELGNQLKQERAWFPVAVRPGGRGWGSQLEQLARAAIEPPELCSVWYESRELPRQTEKSMLMDRVARHAERFKAKAPSGLSWDDVIKRTGTLHRPAFLEALRAEAARAHRDGRPYVEPQRQRRHLELYCGRAPLTVGLASRDWWYKVCAAGLLPTTVRLLWYRIVS